LIPKYSELVYNGFWYAPEREALQALVSDTQKNISGTVRLKLYKGATYTAGRKSPVSLYNADIATMELDPTEAYNQDDATGFINLNALRLKVRSRVQAKKKTGSKKRS
jgi:argininosuccinate synthase